MCTKIGILFTGVLLSMSPILVKAQICNVGNSHVQNFDYKRFAGTWHVAFSNSEEFATMFTCYSDDYSEDGLTLNSSYYKNPEAQQRITIGHTQFLGNQFTINYPPSSGVEEFNSIYTILATDYEKYSIMAGCPPVLKYPVYYVKYRNEAAREETRDVVSAALSQYQVSFEKLLCNCNCQNSTATGTTENVGFLYEWLGMFNY